MFTSRAEHRLHLREDNTLDRLFETAVGAGLLDDGYREKLEKILSRRQKLAQELVEKKISPTEETLGKLSAMGSTPIHKQTTLQELLRRNEISFADLAAFGIDINVDEEVSEAVEVAVKYEGYITRQQGLIHVARKMEAVKIPPQIPYESIRGLSREEVEKLNKVKPGSIAQAQRISGVNPSAIQAILIYLKLHKAENADRLQ
jgi:tRNA uridine 5-carboxymethylaminomethyl modification enzyme